MGFEEDWKAAKIKHRKRIIVRTCKQTGEVFTLWSAYMKKPTGEQRTCSVLTVHSKEGKRLSIKRMSTKAGLERISGVNQEEFQF